MVDPAVGSSKFFVLMRDLQFLQAFDKAASTVVDIVLVRISAIDETEAEPFESLMVLFNHVEGVKGEPSRPSLLIHLARFEING